MQVCLSIFVCVFVCLFYFLIEGNRFPEFCSFLLMLTSALGVVQAQTRIPSSAKEDLGCREASLHWPPGL